MFFYVYMVAYHHPGIRLVDKTSRLSREYSVFSAVCLQADTQWKGKRDNFGNQWLQAEDDLVIILSTSRLF